MILGIDIGGKRIKTGLVNEAGTLVETASAPTPASLDGFVAAVHELIGRVCAKGQPDAAGIGCKGILHPTDTTVEVLPGTMHYLEGQKLSELFASVFPARIPIHADNDARVALAGEAAWGAARGRTEVVMLTLGTGVGGAIISGGKLLRGATGVAGHIGHLTIDPRGPMCICGNRGCLETFFSATAIEQAAGDAVERGCDSMLPPAPTCADVFRVAAEGDRVAALIVNEATQTLAAAIAGLVHILDPEIVILGGQISEAGEALFSPLREEVHIRTRCLLRRKVPLIPPQIVDRSGVVGAAAIATERMRR
ncbi:MAG TPA: ROK family protein [Bryobacteraceae bacterium]|nr:ROK family protein [Bryobacteraceae bacterium]